MKEAKGILKTLRYIYLSCVIVLGLMTIVGTDGGNGNETQHETVEIIGPQGGVVEVIDPESPIYGVKAEFPPGALTEEKTITISPVKIPADLPSEYFAVGKCINFGPDGITFDTPIDIFFPYNDKDNDGIIDGTAITEISVDVMLFNELAGQWEHVEVINRDLDQNSVKVRTNHFSNFTFSNYITRTCEADGELSCGPCYFTLHYAYGDDKEYRASVSNGGIDLNANNTTLYDSYAILEYSGFKDLFDKVRDATRWNWTWEIVTYHTYLTDAVGLEDDDVEVEISAISPTSLQFVWNFDYHQMAAHERLVVKFASTSDEFCADVGN